MSEPTGLAYEFSTFQELYDRVPAERMMACLTELALNFAVAQQGIEMMHLIGNLAPLNYAVKLPIRWEDDGKGEIAAIIALPGSRVKFSVKRKMPT